LLNEVGLSIFRYFEVGLRVCDIVVKKFTFAISSPDEFLLVLGDVRWAKTTGKTAQRRVNFTNEVCCWIFVQF